MEQELSLVLLFFAGIVLVCLISYYIRTRINSNIESDTTPSLERHPFDQRQELERSTHADLQQNARSYVLSSLKEPIEPTFTFPMTQPPLTLLTLYIMPASATQFSGVDLLQALWVANMRFGKMAIFHRMLPADEEKIVCSAAQVTEPGTFDMNTMAVSDCSGLVFFMQLSSAWHDEVVFDLFMQTAEQLKNSLGAELMQKPGIPFTDSTKHYFLTCVQHHMQHCGIDK